MARPTKQGVDYFPVDTQFDDKIELLIMEHGANALSVLITVWQLIYQNEGYYIEYSDDLFLLIKKRITIEPEKSEIIISSAIKRNIFDIEKFDKFKILTSRGIQKRYFIAAKKKSIVSVVENYLMSGVSAGENSAYSEVNVVGNATKEEVEVEVEVKEEANKKKRKKKAAESDPEIDAAFETFWNEYPGKEGKAGAKNHFVNMAKKKEYTVDELIDTAKNYAECCKIKRTEQKYIKKGYNFLGEDKTFVDYLNENYKKLKDCLIKRSAAGNIITEDGYEIV